MKKLICLLVALVALCALTVLVSAETTVPTTCAACGGTPTWEVMPATIPTTAGHYHYYLDKDVTPKQLLVQAGVTMCLDLNGYSIQTDGRSMIVYNGSAVNIMDSSAAQTGFLQGSRGSNNGAGGTICVQENATLSLYSGTLKFLMDDTGSQQTYKGGVIWMKDGGANVNVYGGRIEGGELMQSGNNKPVGGAISVGSNGKLYISGGVITSGKTEGGSAPCIYTGASTASVTITGDPEIEDIYLYSTNNLTVDGTFSGTAYVTMKTTPASGTDIGNGINSPNITGNLFCENGNGWLINGSGSDLKLAAPTAAAHRCQHCKHMVKWTALNTTTLTNTAGQYHMYLSSSYSGTQTLFAADTKVCLDLYGKSWKSSKRALYLNTGVQLNLMDTVGGGYVEATSAGNNPTGGVMVIKSGAVFNMYSGALQLEEKYVAGAGVGTGGIVYMNEAGTFNLYGGTVYGADLVKSEYNLSLNGVGAAFYMNSTSKLNVYGGEIKNGTLADGCIAPCVYLKSTTAKVTVSGDGKIGDIYCTNENDQVTISGTYTGSVNLSYPNTIQLSENLKVGVADNADITEAKVTCGDEWLLKVSGSDLVLIPNAAAILYTDSGAQTFDTLQAAVNAYESGYIKLMKPISETVTVEKNAVLDLNGKTVTGTVTIAEGKTLSVKDTQTDDYTVSDGVYGKLTATGNVVAADGYLKVTEEGSLSFHKYEVAITSMTLRAAEAGIYYNSSFLGDEKVAAAIESFGVALSVIDVPYEKNLATKCVSTEFTGFESGKDGNAAASTLLKGIMKDTNTEAINDRNMAMTVYGRPYLKTADGYLFGQPISRSLVNQLQDIDGMVDSLSGSQRHALKEFYNKFEARLEGLDLSNIEKEAKDETLKILGIGNSYTQDTMWILGEVYKAQKNQNVELGVAYYSGCRLDQHVKFYNSNEAVYQYNHWDAASGKWVSTSNMTLKEIIDATDWDLVSMQQGSGTSGVESTYNSDIQTIQGFVKSTLGYTPTFFWNMTWSYPEVDIPTDNYTPDNAPNSNNFKNYYNSDQVYMYSMICQTVQNKIVPDSTFQWIMPVGTAVQNAKSSSLTDYDLYRDYTHLNDYCRLMAAYVWFSRIEGEVPQQFLLDRVPAAVKKSYTGTGDMVLTELQFNILQESVRNACATPFAVTQSQYTEN